MINFKTISIENINELKDYKNFDKINYRNNIILSAELSYNLHVNILCIIVIYQLLNLMIAISALLLEQENSNYH